MQLSVLWIDELLDEAPHVRTLQPLVHQPQISRLRRAEAKRPFLHRKGIIDEGRSSGADGNRPRDLGRGLGSPDGDLPRAPDTQDAAPPSSREVSIAYFWVIEVGFALWVVYGVTIDNWFLVVPNAVAFAVCLTTIVVALRYRNGSGGGAFDTAA